MKEVLTVSMLKRMSNELDKVSTMSAYPERSYPTDLSDQQWALLEPLLPVPKSGPGRAGRPTVARRQVVNGILYLNKSGCQWRLLPHEFGPWQTVYGYFSRWRRAGVWEHGVLPISLRDLELHRRLRYAPNS